MCVNMSQEEWEGQANMLTMQSTLKEREIERDSMEDGGAVGVITVALALFPDTQNAIRFLPVINVCH